MVTMQQTMKKYAARLGFSLVGAAALSTMATPFVAGAAPARVAAVGASHVTCPKGTTAKYDPEYGVPANLIGEDATNKVKNSGTAYSSIQCYDASGQLVAYGNDAILYSFPASALAPLGEKLYQQNCASCHGVKADGVVSKGTGAYPALLGLGPATVNFWITTGRMPAADPKEVQAARKPPRLSTYQANAIAAYVNSLQPAVPAIPEVNVNDANLTTGQRLYALNCAACHTITGGGDALAQGTYAPSLHVATPTQVAEALRIGPGNMPVFTGNLTDDEVRDIAAYVTESLAKPTDIGGVGMGGLGPVAEGFLALALGVGILMLVSFWVGERQ
jgi:ubiquinol-cytochrome c reductase cytochrome c subunit